MTIEIRLCNIGDIESVMGFLHEHWSANHALSRSKTLMDWQHLTKAAIGYDFVVAFDESQVMGCFGFIRTSRYDPNLRDQDTVWLTTWKVRQDAPMGLGLHLHAYLQSHVPHRWIGTVGNNATVTAIYKALGYTTGTMKQHYVINPGKREFVLAGVPDKSLRNGTEYNTFQIDGSIPSFRRLSRCEIFSLANSPLFNDRGNRVPKRTVNYYVNRFLDHPYYTYEVFAVERNDELQGVFALRTCEANGACALRVVDMFASDFALKNIAHPLQLLLVERNAEYVDWYQQGYTKDQIIESGMLTLDKIDGDIVIPNYFEPFVKNNVEINWAFKLSNNDHFFAFKADGDQDRPNLLT